MMDLNEILAKCDHTLLAQTATWDDIKTVLDDAIAFKTASACIPPEYVKRAKQYVGDRTRICTVIGFPNGYNTTAVKAFEARDAVLNGADELDMVMNIGEFKAGNMRYVSDEIRRVKEECGGKTLKVIVETCLLDEEQKIKACELVSETGADYIKTSTGFSTGGATFADVMLFKSHVKGIKIKAAGGIATIEDAEKMLQLGADRLGTSRIVKLAKSLKSQA